MTSQSTFIAGSYAAVSYPWDRTPLNEWLAQYFANHNTEEAAQELISRDDFTAIPVPKALLSGIGCGIPNLGGINDFSAGNSDDSVFAAPIDTLQARGIRSQVVQNYDKLINSFRDFINALISGDDPTIRATIHDSYADDVKRTKDDLITGMLGVASTFNTLNIIPVNAKEVEVVGETLVASIEGAWEAQVGSNAEKTSQFFELHVVFTLDSTGQYKISDVIHK